MKLLVPRRNTPLARRALPLHGDLDRMLDDVWRGFGFPVARVVAKPGALAPRMDFRETEDEFRIDAELPGLGDADIEVTFEDGVLTIKGERADEQSESSEEASYRRRETYRGQFARSVRLPEDVDAEAIKAVYKNGVLSVTIPKPPEVKPEVRTIPITTE